MLQGFLLKTNFVEEQLGSGVVQWRNITNVDMQQETGSGATMTEVMLHVSCHLI